MISTPSRRRPRRRFARPAFLAASLVAVVAGAGCSNGSAAPSADAFCETARQNPELITDPPLSTPEEIDQSIEFYRLMGQLAPIEIAPEWNQLLEAMETANELVPDNPESEQLVAQTAYASELAAVKVRDWMLERCGIDLPITTIVSHDGEAASVPPGSGAPSSSQPSADSAGSGPASTPETAPAPEATTSAAPAPSETTQAP